MDWFTLDRKGTPVPASPVQWAQAQTADHRWHIAEDKWEAEEGWVWVDTKFLGFDPRQKDERTGAPVLYDTVAYFYPHEGEEARLTQRMYRSRPAAVRGHEQLVRLLAQGSPGAASSNGKLNLP